MISISNHQDTKLTEANHMISLSNRYIIIIILSKPLLIAELLRGEIHPPEFRFPLQNVEICDRYYIEHFTL